MRRRPRVDAAALPAGLHPVLRRVYAGRGIASAESLSLELNTLLPPGLLGIERAASLLADAIIDGKRIVVAGDYDADGATGTALAVLGLRALGAAAVDYVVPNRFTMGYGLSPALAAAAVARGADVLITVDNGIASVSGVAAARAAGLTVIVTDHHLAPPELPAADAIVNPNQPGCAFPSKNLAGVGVMFYTLGAVRAVLRERGGCNARDEPNLAGFLDLVALGTVADLVRLDHNNRVLVAQGLARIRAGRCRPGLLALLEAAGCNRERLSAQDLGFVLGPRLNAAGRLDDMRIGIECLLAPDPETARPLAAQLDELNRSRRQIEQQMRDEALAALPETGDAVGLCVFDDSWHEGVVGLVASRVRERTHRPTIAFAPAADAGMLKGSGRSIRGLHLRDVLAAVDAHHPALIERFGGHAMAAGLSLARDHLDAFRSAFDEHCRAVLSAGDMEAVVETDGELAAEELQLETAQALEQAGPWGQGFPEPLFEGRFAVLSAQPVGADGRHVRYRLRQASGQPLVAIHFDGAGQAVDGGDISIVYQLQINRFRQMERLEILIRHLSLPAR
ncbi:single-stranded-DNA-specific exonuclease RecJ [Castellaniella sp.]|uniref:single-stranded-DNA-specific exonuclease RecJ n=1 Tax=Castellaniella sp. TaxID=1955812 RepID=UPI0039C8561B